MPIPNTPLTWSIEGGLATHKSPLVIQPGSALQLDNVTQPRVNEWRRRNGFTQSALDTSASFAAAPFLVNMGPGGILAHDNSGGAGVYRPSLTSNKWAAITSDIPSDITRVPVSESSTNCVGFAVCGSMWMVANIGLSKVALMDTVGRATTTAALSTAYLRVRCAATAGHLVAFLADNSGRLDAYTVDAASGVATIYNIKASGLHTTFPHLDAIWYGGSTITVVARSATSDQTFFIEFNPATGVAAVNTALTAANQSCSAGLTLLPDPTASGTRFLVVTGSGGGDHTTVLRMNSAGAVLTTDSAEAVQCRQIAGIASSSGNDWTLIYQTAAGNMRANYKASGAVGTPADLRGGNTSALTIDSMAWGEAGASYFQAIIGCHSSSSNDQQNSWVICSFPYGSGAPVFKRHSQIVPLQAAGQLINATSVYQVVRTGTRTFQMALPVLSHYASEAVGGTSARTYSCDVFTQTQMTQASLGTVNVGAGVRYKDTAFLPTNGLVFQDAGRLRSVGTMAPPQAPTLVQSTAGGSLTLLGAYQYMVIIEAQDADGNIWRSPRSEPTLITLTGTNNTITATLPTWNVEDTGVSYSVILYRTIANSSTFRRMTSYSSTFSASITFIDTIADSALNNTEFPYDTGELPNVITPRMSHVATFGDRLWGVNGDFRTELWPSKNLRPGRLPEYAEEGVLDIDDSFGDLTNIAGMDDKGVAFKESAIYYILGDGLSDAGTGQVHNAVQVAADVGSLPGTPVVSTGDKVYFVSKRGIYSIDRNATTDFVGAPVDQYLNQPEVQTPETVYDACYLPLVDEVRFVTTNYVLVYSRKFNYWARWLIPGMKKCLVVNGTFYLFRASDGTIWKEGTAAQTTDQGGAYTGIIRSPWIRPGANGLSATPSQQRLRLRSARIVFTRVSGGSTASLQGKIYRSNDDAKVETFTSGAVGGSVLSGAGEMSPQNQKCTSFSIALVLPSNDTTVRIEGFTALVGIGGDELAVDNTTTTRWQAP